MPRAATGEKCLGDAASRPHRTATGRTPDRQPGARPYCATPVIREIKRVSSRHMGESGGEELVFEIELLEIR